MKKQPIIISTGNDKLKDESEGCKSLYSRRHYSDSGSEFIRYRVDGEIMKIRIAKWSASGRAGVVEKFLKRPAFDAAAERAAAATLMSIRERGAAAIEEAVAAFDRCALKRRQWLVSEKEMKACSGQVSPRMRRAVREAHRRITAFSRASMKRTWRMPTPHGGIMGEQFVPFERVGVYVPGGAAPLASTALMTATLAQVAGVKEIVACTPSDAEGSVNPVLLYALKVAGATEVYRIGGIQAVGLMAYGCGSVKKVQKIVGPGGAYVTAAKRQVYGDVALDLVAGPSEIAVLADETANPEHVAMDLFSQLEHGTGHEKALLVATSQEIAETVADAMLRIGPGLSRWGFLKGVLSGGLMLAVVEDEEAGIDLVNRFAPEHLELLVARPRRVLKKITCAGAIFMGPWTPESVGDFVAGPSHVLPTGGAAAMFSGLTVDDFRRRSSFVDFTRADLMETLPVIEAFGEVEGLDAHSGSAQIRFDKRG